MILVPIAEIQSAFRISWKELLLFPYCIRRHVCTNEKNTDRPMKTKQAYCKPAFKNYSVRCFGDQICKGVSN
ncbi:hypothetical protein NQ318_023259 [Aromia moschata]|uniref:Uncharacterized protein n=1 Tax=Aromia moschata TaxID=1265417 RepID=A0AAV8Y3M0_9CUCU|nr:hypothetical protein NQ318_023259 [Aromia moschata]